LKYLIDGLHPCVCVLVVVPVNHCRFIDGNRDGLKCACSSQEVGEGTVRIGVDAILI
jgi:hypothetical protein